MDNKLHTSKSQITPETLIKFGQYKGYKAKDVPIEYWQYLLDNDICYKGVKHYCKTTLKLEKRTKTNPPTSIWNSHQKVGTFCDRCRKLTCKCNYTETSFY